jgi:DNA-binding NtrC family response regulator
MSDFSKSYVRFVRSGRDRCSPSLFFGLKKEEKVMNKKKTNQKVIRIDNDPDWWVLVQEILQSLDVYFVNALQGDKTYGLLKRNPAACVITDTNRPTLNAIALLKLIRSYQPKLPAIMLFTELESSSLASEEMIALRANLVLSKTQTLAKLEPLLKRILWNEPTKLDS